jgi:hypothetical protein
MALPGESAPIRPRTDGDSDSLPTWLRFVADSVSLTYTWCNGWFSVDKMLSWAYLTLSRIPSQNLDVADLDAHSQPKTICKDSNHARTTNLGMHASV